MGPIKTVCRIVAVLVLLCPWASAQFGPQWSGENPPRNGACFYNRTEFRGMYFCVGAGDSYAELPGHFRKKISSVRIRGQASVQLFDQAGFGGESLGSQQHIPDLAKFAVAQPKRTWDNRVLSLRVIYDPGRTRQSRRTATALRTRPRQGACFFREAGYRGESVCLATGESLDRLPAGFERNIVSVRVYGHADVVIYEGAEFSGDSEHLWSNVADLASRNIGGDPYRTWNKRIGSIEIR